MWLGLRFEIHATYPASVDNQTNIAIAKEVQLNKDHDLREAKSENIVAWFLNWCMMVIWNYDIS